MSAYIDTSILAAYYCPEPMSDRVEAFLLETKEPSVSDLTEVEMASAVSRKVREKHLAPQDAHKIMSKFQAHIDDQRYRRLPVEPKHFSAARSWIARFSTPLRTLDALHLAIAAAAGLPIVTADAGLQSSADLLGVEALLLFEP